MAEIKLRVTTSTGQQTLDGDQQYVVGRGREADVTITGGQLSRRHVVLDRGPSGWVATDASANGMWRDGERVKTVPIGDREVTLRLGAVDGPEIALLAILPEPPARPAPSPATVLGEAETVMAPGAVPGGPPPPLSTPPKPAARPVGQPEPYRAPVPAQPAPPTPAPAPASPAPSPVLHWLRVVPTLIWLLAAGFAIGALIAVS